MSSATREARRLWRRIDVGRSLGLASEMAFWLFLSLLPLAAVGGLLTAKLALGNESIMAPLLDSLPRATRDMVGQELGRVAAWNGGRVGFWSGLTFCWLASSGVHSLFDGIEIEAGATPRPWWKKRILAIGTCVALSVGVALLALLGTGLGSLGQLLGAPPSLRALAVASIGLGRLARLSIGLALAFGLVSGLYGVALPPRTRRSMPLAPGALLATGLHVALGLGYALYLRQAGDGGAYYAGLAAVGVTLMALYLFSVALLIGIRVNQMLGEQRHRRAQGRRRLVRDVAMRVTGRSASARCRSGWRRRRCRTPRSSGST
jgi:membrane protein